MNNSDSNAFPDDDGDLGLTKLEYAKIHILAGMLAGRQVPMDDIPDRLYIDKATELATHLLDEEIT